jgi:hypothetical protein
VVFRPVSVQLGDLVVSLDAIVLTGFVLRDQLHMTIVSDRRAHRFADWTLLAEQELTAVLQMLCGLSTDVG